MILCIVNGHLSQFSEEVIEYHVQTEYILTEPDHPTSTDCGQSSVLEVLYLKHYTDLQGEGGGEGEGGEK